MSTLAKPGMKRKRTRRGGRTFQRRRLGAILESRNHSEGIEDRNAEHVPVNKDDDQPVSEDKVRLNVDEGDNVKGAKSAEGNDSPTGEDTGETVPNGSGIAEKNCVSSSTVSPPQTKRREEDCVQEVYKLIRTVINKNRERDEYDLFGEQIACKLRKLPSDERSNVQQTINTILWTAECGINNNYCATRSSAAPQVRSYNPSNHLTSNSSLSVHIPVMHDRYFLPTRSVSSNHNQNPRTALISGTTFPPNSSCYPPHYPSSYSVHDNQSPTARGIRRRYSDDKHL